MQSVDYNLKPMLNNLKLNKYIIPQSKEYMVEESKGTKKIKPEVLISRFRSK
jgi:two-component SAPR family response regulator